MVKSTIVKLSNSKKSIFDPFLGYVMTPMENNICLVADNNGFLYRVILDRATDAFWEIIRPKQKY